MKPRVVSGVPDARIALYAQLPGADFRHASRVQTVRGGRTALQAYRDFAAAVPG